MTSVKFDSVKLARKFNKAEQKLGQAVVNNRNIDCNFDSSLVLSAVDKDSGVILPAELAAGSEIAFQCGLDTFEMHNAVVETTGTALYSFPKSTTSGLSIALIAANGTNGLQGVEFSAGILSSDKVCRTVGQEAFELRVKAKVADISDLGQMFIGFRKAEAYQADPDNYDEMAAFHIGETGATVADGQINIATILNNAATVYTDTTLTDFADADEKEFRVVVQKNGQVMFYIDDSIPTVVPAFTFDSGEKVVPFIFAEVAGASTNGDPGITISYVKLQTI